MARRVVVGVMGSGHSEHADLAEPLGRWLAEQGFDLLTGGGQGVMAAVCRGFHSVANRAGLTIGVLPAGPPPGYPNAWIDLVIQTHLPARGAEGGGERGRNAINVLSSAVVVALPGGPGTLSEVELARRHGKPLVAYLGAAGQIEGLERSNVTVAVALQEVQSLVRRWAMARQAP